MNSTLICHRPSYMDEFIWHERSGQKYNLAYLHMLRLIAEYYPC